MVEALEMTSSVRSYDESTIPSVDGCIDSSLKRDLLQFWRRHPFAKFTCGIIAGVLECKKRVYVEEALECFVHAELIDREVQRGLPYYSLTTNPSRRKTVLSLCSLMR